MSILPCQLFHSLIRRIIINIAVKSFSEQCGMTQHNPPVNHIAIDAVAFISDIFACSVGSYPMLFNLLLKTISISLLCGQLVDVLYLLLYTYNLNKEGVTPPPPNSPLQPSISADRYLQRWAETLMSLRHPVEAASMVQFMTVPNWTFAFQCAEVGEGWSNERGGVNRHT